MSQENYELAMGMVTFAGVFFLIGFTVGVGFKRLPLDRLAGEGKVFTPPPLPKKMRCQWCKGYVGAKGGTIYSRMIEGKPAYFHKQCFSKAKFTTWRTENGKTADQKTKD